MNAVAFAAVWLGREMKLGIPLHDALAATKGFFAIPDLP
jgi:hypothetical protein